MAEDILRRVHARGADPTAYYVGIADPKDRQVRDYCAAVPGAFRLMTPSHAFAVAVMEHLAAAGMDGGVDTGDSKMRVLYTYRKV